MDVSDYKDNLVLANDQLIGFGNFVAVGYRPVTNQEIFYFINLANTLTKNKWGSLVRADLATKTPYHQVLSQVAQRLGYCAFLGKQRYPSLGI